MKKTLSLALACLLTVVLLSSCGAKPTNTTSVSEKAVSQSKADNATAPAQTGSGSTQANSAPASSGKGDFAMRDINGKEVKLSDFKGKKVYLDLWATWCPNCLRALPEITELAKSNPDFVVLTVVAPDFSGEKSEAEFKAWYNEQTDLKGLPVLFDTGAKLMNELGVRAFPSAAYYDSKGNFVKMTVGALPVRLIKENIAAMP